MKKKVQKMLEWFYEESDRGEQNIAECKTLYDLVERLQYRLEDMETYFRKSADIQIDHYKGCNVPEQVINNVKYFKQIYLKLARDYYNKNEEIEQNEEKRLAEKPDIKEDCSVNGAGTVSCSFRNDGNAKGTLCLKASLTKTRDKDYYKYRWYGDIGDTIIT